MKKIKTFLEAQTANRLKEIFQSPTREKLPASLKQKLSWRDLQVDTDMCFPSASKMQLLGV